jgi:hypothetical protein
MLLLASDAHSQELLTNGGLELVSEAVAGRNAVPNGWQMEEGPWVPELPPNSPPTTPAGTYPGDYNNGGVPAIPCGQFLCGAVDAADYTVWRDHLGQDYQLPNEYPGASTGRVTAADYTRWKQLFGGPNTMSLAEPSNFTHLPHEGDWQVWFQPYNSTRTENAAAIANNFAHLTQTVAGTPGLTYTMSGYALFEDYFPGGVINLNDGTGAVPGTAPFNDGPLSPTDTFFALEFLDGTGALLSKVEVELKADGQPSDATVLMQHTLVGVAPAGTTNVRVRASMINGVMNPLPCDQCYLQSFFVDAFSLTAAPTGAGSVAIPEPSTAILCAIACCVLGVRCRQ